MKTTACPALVVNIDCASPKLTRSDSTYKSGNSVQTNGATSISERAYDVAQAFVDGSMDGERWKYSKQFKDWWSTYSAQTVFGTESNFTKYAKAGGAIRKVHTRFENKSDQLPITLTALYEISQLTEMELTLCLENTYSRTSITEPESSWKRPKKARPLINAQVTATTLKTWRKNWNNPPVAKTEKRTVQSHTIFVHGSIYNVEDHLPHNAKGPMTKHLLDTLNDDIVSLIKKYDPDDKLIRIESKTLAISDGISKRITSAAAAAEKKAAKKKTSKK